MIFYLQSGTLWALLQANDQCAMSVDSGNKRSAQTLVENTTKKISLCSKARRQITDEVKKQINNMEKFTLIKENIKTYLARSASPSDFSGLSILFAFISDFLRRHHCWNGIRYNTIWNNFDLDERRCKNSQSYRQSMRCVCLNCCTRIFFHWFPIDFIEKSNFISWINRPSSLSIVYWTCSDF